MKRMVMLLSVLLIGLWACSGAKIEKPIEIRVLSSAEVDQSNQCPEITAVSVSDSPINAGEQTRIAVTASDPENTSLFYFWSSSGGTLTGRESQVVWTAPSCSERGKPAETYEITVEASDGKCKVNRIIPVVVNCGNQAEMVILFPKGGVQLNQSAQAQLDTMAALLKQFPDQAILLVGHSDARGKETANQQISLKRAESVKRYLVKRHGLEPQRITITSYGSAKPADTNETEAGRANNRRVEIYRKG